MPLFKALSSVKDKLTLTPSELLIKEATSNDDVSVSTNNLYSVAELTFHPSEYTKVMESLWTTLQSNKREWRRIQRALLLADVLMKFGSSRCVQELRDFVDRFKPLQSFKYIDEDGDRGAIIREKSKFLVEVLQDFHRIEQEREAAKKHKVKCVGLSKDDVLRGKFKNNSISDVRGEEKNNFSERKEPVRKIDEYKEENKIDERKIEKEKNKNLTQPVFKNSDENLTQNKLENVKKEVVYFPQTNPVFLNPPSQNSPSKEYQTNVIDVPSPGFNNVYNNIGTFSQASNPHNNPQASYSHTSLQNNPYSQPIPQSNPYSQPLPQNNLYSQPIPQNNPYSQPIPQNNPFSQPIPQNNPYSQPIPQNNPYSQPMPQNNPYSQPIPQTSPYSQPIPQNNPYSQPIPQNNFYSQPIPQNNPYSSLILQPSPFPQAIPNQRPEDFNSYSFQPKYQGANYISEPVYNSSQNKPGIRHNLGNQTTQPDPKLSVTAAKDLESQLMNLDGLEFSLSNKKK